MAEPLIPPGAFAAMKAGAPQPVTTTKEPQVSQPKTVLRKAEPKAPETTLKLHIIRMPVALDMQSN